MAETQSALAPYLPAGSCQGREHADPGPVQEWTIAHNCHREDRAPGPSPNAGLGRRAAVVRNGGAGWLDWVLAQARPEQSAAVEDNGSPALGPKMDLCPAVADILPPGTIAGLAAAAGAAPGACQTRSADPDRLRAGAEPATRCLVRCRGSATSWKSPRNIGSDCGPSNRESNASNPAPRRPASKDPRISPVA